MISISTAEIAFANRLATGRTNIGLDTSSTECGVRPGIVVLGCSVRAVACDVGRLAVLPRVVLLRPRVHGVAYNVVYRNQREIHKEKGCYTPKEGSEAEGLGEGRKGHVIRRVRTEREGDRPVDELAGEAAVAVEDVVLEHVLRGALPEGREA